MADTPEDSSSKCPRHEQIAFEQLRLLFSGLPIALGISVAVSTLIVFVEHGEVDQIVLYGWYAAMMAVVALRAYTAWRFARARGDAARAPHWYRWFLAGVLAGGILWAVPAFWQYEQHLFSQQNFILLMILGMCAGAITTLSYRRETVMLFTLPILGAASLRLITEGTLAGYALAGGLGLFLLGLILSSRHICRVTRENIELQLDAAVQQDRIKTSEEMARAQFMGIPVPTYTWKRIGEDFVLADYNEAAIAITQGAIARLVGTKLSDLYRRQPEIREEIERCFHTRKPIEREMPYYFEFQKRHAYLAVKYAFVPPDRVLVHTEDITARVQTLEQLRQSRERLAQAQHIARLGDWQWDLTTGKIDWSEEIYRIFELDPATTVVSQELFMSAVHPDDVNLIEASTARALEGVRHFDEEWRIITHQGTLKYIHLLGERYFSDSGQPIRMVGTLQDITDRKLAEVSKNDFISMVSHELRTPLTSIHGSIGLLRGNLLKNEDPRINEMLRIADDNSRRLINLVNDLLDVSRISTGRFTFKFDQVVLQPLLVEAVNANEGYAGSFHVSLQLDSKLDPDLAVHADKARLMQVMDNLISNAIKNTIRDTVVRIVARTADGHVRIDIEDEGPGIPEEFRDKIFDKFSRADNSNTRATGGTGLGLHITRFIVEQHHGEIGYLNREPHGATFHLTLPVHQC